MAYANTITFGILNLYVDTLRPVKVPHTSKQVIGKRLILKELPGATTQDWSITINGHHVNSDRHTDRTTLEGYDNLIVHKLTDGIHDGNYFITSLVYNDDVKKPTSYSFTLTLIQDQ